MDISEETIVKGLMNALNSNGYTIEILAGDQMKNAVPEFTDVIAETIKKIKNTNDGKYDNVDLLVHEIIGNIERHFENQSPKCNIMKDLTVIFTNVIHDLRTKTDNVEIPNVQTETKKDEGTNAGAGEKVKDDVIKDEPKKDATIRPKRSKKPVNANAPPKSKSGYQTFVKEKAKEMGGGKDWMKKVAELWKTLSKADKDVYTKKAKDNFATEQEERASQAKVQKQEPDEKQEDDEEEEKVI